MLQIGGHENILAAVTPTANSSATGYPASRVQNRRLWHRTRTEAATYTLELTWDLGAAVDIPYWCGLGHNLSDAATVRVRVANVSDFSITTADTGTDPAFDLSRPRVVDSRPAAGLPVLVLPASPWNGRYLRVTLADGSPLGAHLELGHAVAGELLDYPVRRMPSLVSDASDGAAALRQWVMPAMLTEAEADQVRTLHAWSRTTHGRLLVIPRPDETDSWQYLVIWGVAASDSLETAYRADATKKVEVTLAVQEVSV